jgi:hypothetical protein
LKETDFDWFVSEKGTTLLASKCNKFILAQTALKFPLIAAGH